MNRRTYLDWLRGVAVLIMIEGHTLDSWTRIPDKQLVSYKWAIVVAGLGAPVFLFLAGVSLMLAADARRRKGMTYDQVVRTAVLRGLWILLLAFLFRLQSFLISGGSFPGSLLKVDILNVMGVVMAISALGLLATRTTTGKAALYAVLTFAVAMVTPLVREVGFLTALPDPIEAYFRPVARLANFSLFPWAAFLTAGAALGAFLERTQGVKGERRTHAWVFLAGAVLAAVGWGTSFLPSPYASSSFWTSSPAFFFLRLGILLLIVPVSYWLSTLWRAERLQRFGKASLFVYWVHVELVYGVVSAPLHGRLPFAAALAAFALFAIAMYALVVLKEGLRPIRLKPARLSGLSCGLV